MNKHDAALVYTVSVLVFPFAEFFGLFPPFDLVYFASHEKKCQTFKKVCAVFWSLLLIFSYSYLEWLGATTTYKVIRLSSIFLNILVYSSLTAICLISILGNVFWNKSKWSQYVKLQNILKNKLHLTKMRRNKVYFSLEVLLGHVVFIIVAGVDQYRNLVIYNSFQEILSQIIATVIKDILYYYIFLITIIIYNMALLLRNDFLMLKYFLASAVPIEKDQRRYFSLYRPVGNIIFPKFVVMDQTLTRLLEGPKILNILFECVDLFNGNFGLIILLLNFSTVITILASLNNLLVTGELNQLSAEVASNSMCEFLIFLTWNSFVTSACGLLKQECEIIIKLCCKLQHLLPRTSKERHELLNLARQVDRKSPTISAAGFFDVDFSLIFSVFTYVGTYIVVLIQFSHISF